MRVSIVICTYNRAKGLAETLDSLRFQNFDDFEVIVVNGPSTDDTDAVLKQWCDRVVVERCPEPNLSMSRNIGIRATSGDIVAFIDDDALPDFDWLQQALPAFADHGVAGVGGIVFDHTGVSLQYKYSACNRFAEVTVRHDRPYDGQCAPGAFEFPYLQGTNALFRRDALLEIGGFDETFDYYLDETDVCARLIDAGYMLRQLANAPVHHKFLPSSVRDHQRVITNWFPIMKNQVYFSYRHALDPFSEYDIHQHSQAFLVGRVRDAQMHENAGRLPVNAANRARIVCSEAFRVGMQLGWDRRFVDLGPVDWPRHEFKRFPTVDMRNRRKITLVSSGYVPNMTGGIARFFSDLAPALAKRGHEVRVITKAIGSAAVDLEGGVWVHRIESPPAGENGVAPEVFAHINDFATSVVAEINRIGTWSSHDLVYGPMWDVEVLGVLDRTGLPVALQVATPVAVAAELAGHLVDPSSADAMGRLIALERRLIDEADLFHANSFAVETTIRDSYSETVDPKRWGVVHLGLIDNRPSEPTVPGARKTVLFVGRFEVRKGIDTLMTAIARIAPGEPDVDFVLAGEDRPLAPGQPLYGASWLGARVDAPWIDRVRVIGTVSDAELHTLYSRADLVVLPSRYESFGLVMVEAMMHGKALITCDTSGIRDVVRDGVDGVMIPPGDIDALETAIRDLLHDDVRRAQLGDAARQRYLDAFHVDRFAERFDEFLDRLRFHLAADVVGIPSPVSRASTGSSTAQLSAGDRWSIVVQPESAVRLVVQNTSGATICVDGRSVRLPANRIDRIPVDAKDGIVEVEVVDGEITLWGVIEVGAVSLALRDS